MPVTASAQWAAPGTGRGYASADVAPAGKQPTVSIAGRNATVTWAASQFADGTNVNGYLVNRYDAVTNALAAVGSSCSGTITVLTCTEAAVPPGSWYYTITPKHQSWLGTAGPSSVTATVAAPSLTFASAATITALPSAKTGTIASFVTGETVTWRLDNATTGTVLAGSIVPKPGARFRDLQHLRDDPRGHVGRTAHRLRDRIERSLDRLGLDQRGHACAGGERGGDPEVGGRRRGLHPTVGRHLPRLRGDRGPREARSRRPPRTSRRSPPARRRRRSRPAHGRSPA